MFGKVKNLAFVFVLSAGVAVSSVAIAQTADVAKEAAKKQVDQPLNNAPVWKEIRQSNPNNMTTTSRNPEGNVLIQSDGLTWRQIRNGPITLYGGALVAFMLAAIGLFYKRKGTIKLKAPATGKTIQRFSDRERMMHWATAISFSILGISGLILFFGKHILQPVLGYTLFSWIARLCIVLHNFVGPIFFLCAIGLFFTFVRDNFPKAYDLTWLKKGGGLASGEHIPSDRFNAGEKVWFWGGLALLGIVVSLSGLVLDFPNFAQTRGVMQTANIVHVIGALLFIIGSFGHIYMGTVGMEGAYKAMREGKVDEAWAKEHHEYWYNDIKSGKIKPAAASAKPAPASQAKA
ncbi:MAG: Formate dehydrogenase, gamma subunit [Pseudomonadota bacterium]